MCASNNTEKIAVICVGNKLMLDDGVGPFVYEELTKNYTFPSNVEIFDVGCMSYSMINLVDDFDYIITVDAVDATEEPAGSILEYSPNDIQPRSGASASLHELTLTDLFDAAFLLGYKACGKCFGIQVENPSPAYATIGLTPKVIKSLPFLIDFVLAELVSHKAVPIYKKTGESVASGWHHRLSQVD